MAIFNGITSLKNIFASWFEFRVGKRRRRDVQYFARHLEEELFSLQTDLRSGQYRHGPYEMFRIHDPKPRVIHKATVRDRIVHHAIHRVLYPLFDRRFVFDSYSCRVGKGTHAGVRRVREMIRAVTHNYERPGFVLKCDIRRFFDSVDHVTLLGLLARRITDPSALRLVAEVLNSFSFARIQERERERELKEFRSGI